MSLKPAIVNPARGAKPPDLGRVALIVASEADLGLILRRNEAIDRRPRKLYMSRLYKVPVKKGYYALVGPILGAPYAAMVAETLIAWGIQKIIFLGWCGAVSQTVATGEIVVPESALIDDGTSPNYIDRQDIPAFADYQMLTTIKTELKMRDLRFHSGPIWTTDAVFRETVEKVRHYRARGALGVEMETAALFSVARFRNIAAGAVLIVSDELSTFKWRPGFKTPEFKNTRHLMCSMVADMCREMAE